MNDPDEAEELSDCQFVEAAQLHRCAVEDEARPAFADMPPHQLVSQCPRHSAAYTDQDFLPGMLMIRRRCTTYLADPPRMVMRPLGITSLWEAYP